jgi:hypothetical protein
LHRRAVAEQVAGVPVEVAGGGELQHPVQHLVGFVVLGPLHEVAGQVDQGPRGMIVEAARDRSGMGLLQRRAAVRIAALVRRRCDVDEGV